jgi:hypothetical protein
MHIYVSKGFIKLSHYHYLFFEKNNKNNNQVERTT